MTQGKITWNNMGQGAGELGVTTTLTINCRPDGSIHMETPTSQGGFSGDYQSTQEASQQFAEFLQQGLQQTGTTSS